MENYNEYRAMEAEKLRKIRQIDKEAAKAYLEKLKESDEYQQAELMHRQERANSETESVADEPESVGQDTKEALESNLPAGFEISEGEDGKLEIILADQDNFEGWDEVLSNLKEKEVELEDLKIYDLEGQDDKYTEIKNPYVSIDGINAVLRFNSSDIDENNLKSFENNELVSLSHVLGIVNKRLIIHKGMLRSIKISK